MKNCTSDNMFFIIWYFYHSDENQKNNHGITLKSAEWVKDEARKYCNLKVLSQRGNRESYKVKKILCTSCKETLCQGN